MFYITTLIWKTNFLADYIFLESYQLDQQQQLDRVIYFTHNNLWAKKKTSFNEGDRYENSIIYDQSESVEKATEN